MEKVSANSQIKITVDHASSSLKSIVSKKLQIETPSSQLVNPAILGIQKQDRGCEAISTISSNEFKEAINSSIQKAALHSKIAKESIREPNQNAIFENDLLNQNLQQSFLPLIDKFGAPLKNLALGNHNISFKDNQKSLKHRSLIHRERNASMINARQSHVISKAASSIPRKKNERSYIQSPSFKEQFEFEHLAPKPIKDPRYLKIKAEFKKMLDLSKFERNSEMQKPFPGDSIVFLDDSNNFMMNSLSPIFKPKSNGLKKLIKNKRKFKSKLAFRKLKLTD